MKCIIFLICCLYTFQFTNAEWIYDEEVSLAIKQTGLVLDGSSAYLRVAQFEESWGQIWVLCPGPNNSVVIRNALSWNVIQYEVCEEGASLSTTVHYSNATQQWFLTQEGTIVTYCESGQVLNFQSGFGDRIVLASYQFTASITYFEVVLLQNTTTVTNTPTDITDTISDLTTIISPITDITTTENANPDITATTSSNIDITTSTNDIDITTSTNTSTTTNTTNVITTPTSSIPGLTTIISPDINTPTNTNPGQITTTTSNDDITTPANTNYDITTTVSPITDLTSPTNTTANTTV